MNNLCVREIVNLSLYRTQNNFPFQTNVPFGLIVSPMARIAEGEYEPPIVDMGEIGPVRCVRCKAYMSPFMQFIDAGRRFQCMFCKATTEGTNLFS